MPEFIHTNASVIPIELMENSEDKVETEEAIKNIRELFKRDDIKKFNALLESRLVSVIGEK